MKNVWLCTWRDLADCAENFMKAKNYKSEDEVPPCPVINDLASQMLKNGLSALIPIEGILKHSIAVYFVENYFKKRLRGNGRQKAEEDLRHIPFNAGKIQEAWLNRLENRKK